VKRGRDGGALLLALAVIVSAVNLRTAVTSVGALLPELDTDLGMSSQQAGLLTALPLITFGVIGWQTPRLGRLLGDGSALAVSLVVMTAGLLLRSLTNNPSMFLTATVLALAGGAVGNVTIPTIIKAAFPNRIGTMTAAYITAMAVGQSLAAGLSIPVAKVAGDRSWRLGIGLWAVVSTLAVLAWIATPAATRGRSRTRRTPLRNWDVARSRTAWMVTIYFAAQSAQVFVVFGWFTTFFRDAGLDANAAASLVALYSLLFIPISLLVPLAMTRLRRQTLVLTAPALCAATAYAGMLLWGASGALIWIILAAAGNAAFPAVLTLFTLRTQAATTTAALAAFSQSVGYALASLGPLLIGWLRGATQAWTAPISVLLGVAGLQLLVGLTLGRERYVERDLEVGRRHGGAWPGPLHRRRSTTEVSPNSSRTQ
jgi:MFS transporter, CP family, cyanate transporter